MLTDWIKVMTVEFSKDPNRAATELSIREQYPPSLSELWRGLQGIRPARFVTFDECSGCKLSYNDHTVGWRYDNKVCLKDLKRAGIKFNLT